MVPRQIRVAKDLQRNPLPEVNAREHIRARARSGGSRQDLCPEFVQEMMRLTWKKKMNQAGILSGLLVLLTSTARAELTPMAAFYSGGVNWHMGTFVVGDVTGDSQLEVIVPYRDSNGRWWLDGYKWSGERLSGFPYDGTSKEINATPTLFDLNNDGKAEIIFTCGQSVIAMRGNGTIYWSNQVNRLNYVPNGGYMVVTNGFYMSGNGLWTPNLPTSAGFYSQISPPMVADIDGNGVKEVVTGWKIKPDSVSLDNQDFNPFINNIYGFAEWGTVGENWSGGIVFHDAANGAKKFVYHVHQLVETGLAIGQADADKPLEVYGLNDSDSIVCFDKTKPHGLYGKGQLHKQFGKNQRLIAGGYQKSVDVSTADIDGDGLAEVLVPTTQWEPLWTPHETILDDDGAIMWRKFKPEINLTHVHGWLNNATMIPVNPDHDNRIDVLTFTHSYEIAFRTWNGVELVDRPGWPKSFYPYLPTPPVMGDVDGDGEEDIVIATYNPAVNPSSGTLNILALNGTVKESLDIPGGVKQIPTLADVDGNGSLDIIVRTLGGVTYVLNNGATTANKVSWGTHRGNAQHDSYYNVSLYPPGTPLVTNKVSGLGRTYFGWTAPSGFTPTSWQIRRSEHASGPYVPLQTLPGNATSYTDAGLKSGWQYFYEVAAVYTSGVVPSVPFAITPLLNSNLVANAAFEENDNSHWDKWYTGEIDWTNMIGSTNCFQGKQSMKIDLRNYPSYGSIKQYNQYGIPDASIPVTPGKLYSFGAWFKSGGLSVKSEHWMEWSSPPDGYSTNARPGLPWPNYFTPHFVVGTTQSGWAYANRTFILPAGFSNVELRHRYEVTGNVTGPVFIDNASFRPLPATNDSRWVSWINMSSRWKHLTSVAPANWYATNFNDLFWIEGQAKFGCGTGPLNIITPVPQKQPTYYFRQKFVVASTNMEELLLTTRCSDFVGGVGSPMRIYINGREVPATGIEAVLDGNTDQFYDLTPFLDWIKPGTNVLAIALNNTWQPDWDIVAFDASLRAMPSSVTYLAPPPASARITSVQPGAGFVNIHVNCPVGSVWRVEYNDTFGAGDWATLTTVSNTGSPVMVTDRGALGRNAPNLPPFRFYRLTAQ